MAALIATTLLVILVQDIPLSYYIQGVQRDRIDGPAIAAFAARLAANTDAILDRLIAERQELQ